MTGTPAWAIPVPPEALDALADALADRVAARLAERIGGGSEDGWLDTKRAADYAGCSTNSLQKAMAANEVRFTQEGPGCKAWFKREWIDTWRGL